MFSYDFKAIEPTDQMFPEDFGVMGNGGCNGKIPFNGKKQDIVLSEEQLKILSSGAYIVVQIGEWEDGTPSFLRISAPNSSP